MEAVFYMNGTKKPDSDKLFDEIVKSGELDVITTKAGYTVKVFSSHDVFKNRGVLVKHLGEDAVKECEARMAAEAASAKKSKKKPSRNTGEDFNETNQEEAGIESESA